METTSSNGDAGTVEAAAPERITEPPTAAEGTGGQPVTPPPAKPDPAVAQMMKRMKVIEKVGHKVRDKSGEIEKQETIVASAKARLDAEREDLHDLERQLQALQEDLTNLANGGFSERLDFPDPKKKDAKKPAAAATAPAVDDGAWRSVLIADLAPALKAGKLKALTENTPPILTMGEMCDWQASKGEWWWKDIKGFGETGVEQYADAASRYWAEHPQQPAAPVEPAKAALLKWEPQHEIDNPDGIFAPNTAGIFDGFGGTAGFYVEADDGKFTVTSSDSQLMPDENPCDFDTLEAAQAWAEARNAELLAQAAKTSLPEVDNSAPAAFDDDDKLGIPSTIIKIDGKLRIEVSQRLGGKWASSWFAAVVSNVSPDSRLQGHHASKAEAITAAADACIGWLNMLTLAGKAAKARADILGELAKVLSAEMATA